MPKPLKKLSIVRTVPVGQCVYMKNDRIVTSLPLTENPKDYKFEWDTMLISPEDAQRLGYTQLTVH